MKDTRMHLNGGQAGGFPSSKASGPVSSSRAFPHSLEAERGVLGCLLIDPAALYEIPELAPAAFFSTAHGAVFAAMQALLHDGVEPDFITLPERLAPILGRTQNEIAADLLGYTLDTPNSLHVRDYARIVWESDARRRLIRAAGQMATHAWDETMPLAEVLSAADAGLLAITAPYTAAGGVSLASHLSAIYDTALDRHQAGGQAPGLRTQLTALDRLLRGLKRQRLYVLAARPGMGKSALATTITLHATRSGAAVAFFSLEMSAEEVAQRLVAADTGLGTEQLEEGRLNEEEWARFGQSLGALSQTRVTIDDTPGITPEQLLARCRRLRAQGGLDLVIVDYLQLIGAERPLANETAQLTVISRGLKNLAKELDAPVLALSQLSRAVESRNDKRPQLSDLRGSGSIEQDADVVLFLYRDDYYNREDTPVPGEAEVIVAKNRQGRLGTAYLRWDPDRTMFRHAPPART